MRRSCQFVPAVPGSFRLLPLLLRLLRVRPQPPPSQTPAAMYRSSSAPPPINELVDGRRIPLSREPKAANHDAAQSTEARSADQAHHPLGQRLLVGRAGGVRLTDIVSLRIAAILADFELAVNSTDWNAKPHNPRQHPR